jgi:hypothetical protein
MEGVMAKGLEPASTALAKVVPPHQYGLAPTRRVNDAMG